MLLDQHGGYDRAVGPGTHCDDAKLAAIQMCQCILEAYVFGLGGLVREDLIEVVDWGEAPVDGPPVTPPHRPGGGVGAALLVHAQK